MKHVFTDCNKIAHLWAYQQQDSARNTGNYYFNGRTIYSYGSHFPIATISSVDNNVVFFTRKSYSNTTSKHIHTTYRSINHKNIIYVDSPRDFKVYSDEFWIELTNYSKLIYECLKSSKKPRIRPQTIERYLVDAESHKAEALKFLNVFGLNFDTLENKERLSYKRNKEGVSIQKLWFKKGAILKADFEDIKRLFTSSYVENAGALIDAKNEADKKAEAQQKAKQNKIRKKAIAENKKRLEQWKKGEDVNTYYLNEFPIELREKGEYIETSHGADVKTADAKLLYLALKRGSDVLGKEIGRYTVIENTNEHIKIGCHVISKKVVNEFAQSMQW